MRGTCLTHVVSVAAADRSARATKPSSSSISIENPHDRDVEGAHLRLPDPAFGCRLGRSQAVSVFGIRTKRRDGMSAVMRVSKNNLSLAELMDCAYEQIDQYRSLLGQARQSREAATLAIFRAGEWLSLARKKFKTEGRGKWTAFLKEYGIPRTTGWEAQTLFERAKTEGAVGGMTPTEAKRKFKVVKPKKTTTSEPTVPSVKAGHVTAGTGKYDGTSMPITPRRYGEPPSDHDQDWRQADVAPPRPKPTPVVIPAPTSQESDVVEGDASAPSGAAEPDTVPATTPANEQPTPGEKQSLLTTIVQIGRLLELLVEDLPRLDLTSEPRDAINREIDQCVVALTKLKGGIAR